MTKIRSSVPTALHRAVPDFMKWANLREMHGKSAAGKILDLRYDEGEKKFWVRAQVVDDNAWKKVKTGVYRGFSIGGSVLENGIEVVKSASGHAFQRLTNIKVTEISLVDRPSNPDARITLWKGTGLNDVEENQEETVQEQPQAGQETTPPVAATQDVEVIETPVAAPTIEKASKSAPDPQAIVASIQALRNQYELDGSTDAASLLSQAIGNIMTAAGEDGGDDDDDDEDEEGDGTDPDDNTATTTDPSADPADGATPPPAADGKDKKKSDSGNSPMEMASQILDLAKAGRVISTNNLTKIQSIHDAAATIVQAAIDLGASDASTKAKATKKAKAAPTAPPPADPSGDSLANGKASGPTDLAKASGLTDDALEAAFTKAATPLFEKLAESMTALATRLEVVERQPSAGGPVLTPAGEKARVGTSSGVPTDPNSPQARIQALEAQIEATPNAFAKRSLEEQLAYQLIRLEQQKFYS